MNDFKYDYYRMTGLSAKNKIQLYSNIFFRHNIRFMYIYRKKPSLFRKLLLYRMSRKFGLEISGDAIIGPGLYLGHPYNITVAEGVKIGKNVNLHKGCTIGRENRGTRCGVPYIGDNVFVGINATIVGNIRIGSDVFIAPNSFVNFDVPGHSVVLGNPEIIHRKENATEGYINYII